MIFEILNFDSFEITSQPNVRILLGAQFFYNVLLHEGTFFPCLPCPFIYFLVLEILHIFPCVRNFFLFSREIVFQTLKFQRYGIRCFAASHSAVASSHSAIATQVQRHRFASHIFPCLRNLPHISLSEKSFLVSREIVFQTLKFQRYGIRCVASCHSAVASSHSANATQVQRHRFATQLRRRRYVCALQRSHCANETQLRRQRFATPLGRHHTNAATAPT